MNLPDIVAICASSPANTACASRVASTSASALPAHVTEYGTRI